MSEETCGACKFWLADSWDERGVCSIDAARWTARLRNGRGYDASVTEVAIWTLDHERGWDLPACKRWRRGT